MSFIQFESGNAKERARQELRDARELLLKKAEFEFKQQEERVVQKKLRGEDNWMLPALVKKLDSHHKAKKKKSKDKKVKKHKRPIKEYSSSSSSNSDEDDSADEKKSKKNKKHKKRRRQSATDSDEWVEKPPTITSSTSGIKRDDWMSGMLIPTFSKDKKPEKEHKSIDSYDPGKFALELNPYWKNGGNGLPTFQKPRERDDDVDDDSGHRSSSLTNKSGSQNWRKKKLNNTDNVDEEHSRHHHRRHSSDENPSVKSAHRSDDEDNNADGFLPPSRSPSPLIEGDQRKEVDSKSKKDFLTDQQMNELGAKIIKAEIMGDDDLIATLKQKLERAREYRTHFAETVRKPRISSSTATTPKTNESEHILLTTTNVHGQSRPLQRQSANKPIEDPWGGRSKKRGAGKKVETHNSGGERVRYFADDEKYDIKQMFENERFSSGRDQEEQFVEIAGRHKNRNDDLEDIFAEQASHCDRSDGKHEERAKQQAIRQHQQIATALDTCTRCFDSPKMEKQLLVSMGQHVYLSLPWHEALVHGQCQIVPIKHVACATQLDEDVWAEVKDFQKALTRMFQSRGQDVVFFETARYLHKRPHMSVQCVASQEFELAPFYFKKAIQESEREWSTNKQLVTLREDRDLRRSIPKGLPYFWVHFGMSMGFAHVIEEQERFPENFAQEIIGGLLNLDVRKWKRPRREQNIIPKVKQFADWWKKFDCTTD